MGFSDSQETSNNDDPGPSKRKKYSMKNNKYAEKKTRRVELGWIHNGKQVRKRKGGGTRTVYVPKDSQKSDLLRYAKEIFFPKGTSKYGSFDTFSYDILDYQEDAVLDDGVTIGELYTILKMGVLRFYLCTLFPNDESKLEVNSKVIRTNTNEDDKKVTEESDQNKTIVILTSDLEEHVADVFSYSSELMFGHFLGEPFTNQLNNTLSMQESFLQGEDEPIITSITECKTSAAVTPQNIAFVSDDENSTETSYHTVCLTVKLHRVNLLDELISQFKDPVLIKHPLKYTFINELGADADGVSRDVYAAFWEEFMDHAAEGEEQRVPLLSPKWQEEEWKSMGRILVKGFQDYGYFPTCLSPAFAVAIIFGEHEVSTEMLFESLLMYMSQTERDLLTTALKELHGEDRDDLLDLLDRMGVTSLPVKDNLKGILLQVAHKQIIQKPRHALEKMSLTASDILKQNIHSPQDVQSVYEGKKPTTRTVLKLLTATPTTQAENQSFRFLQQYIIGLDDAKVCHRIGYYLC